jgi:hypothetical protein
MFNENDSLELSAAKLQMSPTLERLALLAQNDCPLDAMNPDDLRTGLASMSIPIIDALDHNRITFANMEDKAMFYGLLMTAVDYVMGGKLSTALQSVTNKH